MRVEDTNERTLVSDILVQEDLTGTANAVAQRAVRILPAQQAAVAMWVHSRPRVLAATDQRAVAMAEAQLSALANHPRVVPQPRRSLMIPLRLDHELDASLHLSISPAFSSNDLELCLEFAQPATLAMSVARSEWQQRVIGQAQRILMDRFHLDEQGAFAVLLRRSQTRHVRVRTIADAMVAAVTAQRTTAEGVPLHTQQGEDDAQHTADVW